MADQHTINIPAHPNIYLKENDSERELQIEFSTPQNGVTADTGLLIFVPGFGANINSKVYTKMREQFADEYNLVTIQCDYFGSKFMQGVERIKAPDRQALRNVFSPEEIKNINQDPSKLLVLLKDKRKVFSVQADLQENIKDFNDMSLMQSIDIITALEAVKIVLEENGMRYDNSRLIGYGHSHGAYLLHLSNVLAPHLFSFLIDNSAWMEPVYLSKNRYLYQKVGQATLSIEFDYLAKKLVQKKHIINLKELYTTCAGGAKVLSFQGNDDNLINHMEKEAFVETLNGSEFILVTEKDVDNKKYRSNNHGLNADFLELFSFALCFEQPKQEKKGVLEKHKLSLANLSVHADFTTGLPKFDVIFRS
ncbi:DUF2920 family protein [Sediminibacillus albus]|uniref:DUF2920 family protein n=1 Tax=Sediminibacillus albus TaxID=407036 RepID=A0A1G9BEU2_9BACI|nr:DUF2920 family protein [Sediminibacillus albus]SDK37365.1 Protein of unknown function [Sediminibacillus albus]